MRFIRKINDFPYSIFESGSILTIGSFDGLHLGHQKLIQEIRDETHRFSITKQKRKQRKLSVGSILDNLKGIGPQRKKLLIRYFGSVEQIKRASSQDIMNVPGLGEKTAVSIYNQLK